MEAELSYNNASSGSYTVLDNVRDLTFTLEAGEADVTTRGNSGWRAYVGTLREASLEFEMIWDTQDSGFDAVKDNFLDPSNNPIFFKALDATGGSGLHARFVITSFSRNEALEEAQTVSVVAKVTYDGTFSPTWIDGTGANYASSGS
tara:strand:+ start:2501 stop:2941 length:441 start_codon:yes stop_codon:yes gene_type:complete